MAIANNNEEEPLITYTFKKLCNGEQWLAAQHEFPGLSIKILQLSLCPVYYSGCKSDYRYSPTIDGLDDYAAIQFRFLYFPHSFIVLT